VYATNCAIGSTVMQTAADLKVSRFIYTSTCQVYGQWGGDLEGMRLPLDQFPMTESQAHRPQNPYGLSKSSNERFAEWVSRETGMPVAIFRLPYVLSARSAERWVRWCNDSSYDYQHRPDGFWTFVHAEDVAEGFLQAVESPQTGCEAYHLFAEDIVGKPSLRERAGAMGLANLALPVDWPAQASPTTSAKAREHFGWRPKHSWASLSASFDGV
jgi:UDP-glucose 4-epimerase